MAAEAVATPALVEATVVPSSVPAAAVVDDAPDELPAVGKVAAEGATRSMWQAFKKATPQTKTAEPASAGRVEPAHLASIRAQAVTRLPGNRAAMFESARFVDWSDDRGVATLWFPHDAVSAANYVKKYRGEFEAAFADQLGQAVTFAFEVEPEPLTATAQASDARPKVIRPNLDDVAAEAPEETLRPTIDVDAVKDDPIVAALLKAFDGSRIVKVE